MQTYASADLGNVAYETDARQGLVVDEDIILDILRPGTGDPVVAGEVGEVVVISVDSKAGRNTMLITPPTAFPL